MSIKTIIKSILTYVCNPINMMKIGHVGKSVHVGRHLHVQGGKNIRMDNDVRIGSNARLACFGEGSIQIEEGCYICDNFSALSGSCITVGRDTLIASGVAIVAENHGINPEAGIKYASQPLSCKPVSIGDNCWIGEKAMILQGVTVGKWSVIGGGTIVTKDVPPYSIAVGNPAKVIKRYDFETHKWEKV